MSKTDIVGFGDSEVVTENTSILCAQCVLDDLVSILKGVSTLFIYFNAYRYPVRQRQVLQTYKYIACPRCGKYIFSGKEF